MSNNFFQNIKYVSDSISNKYERNSNETSEIYIKFSDYSEKDEAGGELKSNYNIHSSTFASIVENSHEGIIIFSEDYKIVYVNAKLCSLFQIEKEKVLNIDYRKLFSEEISREISQKFDSVKMETNPVMNFRVNTEQKNGRKLFFEFNLILVNDTEEKKLIVGQLLDLTDKKAAEKELMAAKDKAENANKLKTEFLAQISHEIRTPINTLISFAQLLNFELENIISDDLKTGFEMMQRAGRRIVRTTDLILNMSEIQLGTYEPNLRNIDLVDDIFQNLCKEFKIVADKKFISFSINKETRQTQIVADEFTITQIFRNLLDNAFKFTFTGKVELNIFKLNNKQLAVDVKDTGIGISKEYIPYLFTTFSQEEQGYTRKFEGTGLGLALVKQYCQVNNASIEVESEKGIGSRFRVIFN